MCGLQVHSLANGPEVQKSLMETSRRVGAGRREARDRNLSCLPLRRFAVTLCIIMTIIKHYLK